jgi:hypothetical protein
MGTKKAAWNLSADYCSNVSVPRLCSLYAWIEFLRAMVCKKNDVRDRALLASNNEIDEI